MLNKLIDPKKIDAHLALEAHCPMNTRGVDHPLVKMYQRMGLEVISKSKDEDYF